MTFENNITHAHHLDQQDPLAAFRNEFIIPPHNGGHQTYFLGNSLGLQPRRTQARLQEVLNNWAQYGVEAFFMGDNPWLQYHDTLTAPMASIVGAGPHEVVVMNQLTVNLHLMMVSFYRPQGRRRMIICEAKAFPSDQYMFQTHVQHLGFNPGEVIIEVAPRAGEHTIRLEDILHTIKQHKEELALVLWGGINYYTGQLFDMAAITSAAQAAGAKVGFDLAHVAGNVPVQLHDWNVDFACWCTYKYLNSGPGAIGGVYIHERYHNDPGIHRLAGWWGYLPATRFQMQKGFVPAPSAEGWQLSTPSLLLYAAHKAALEIIREAGWEAIQLKRIQLNNWLWFLLEQLEQSIPPGSLEIITPRNPAERGCQVSLLMHHNGKKIFDHLTTEGFIVDWREPNVIRFAPVPLYNTFAEIWHFIAVLKKYINQ
jgi:kynureninase